MQRNDHCNKVMRLLRVTSPLTIALSCSHDLLVQCLCIMAGKNRPLDEEEVQFVDALEAASRDREQEQRKQELDALEAYQLVGSKAATCTTF